MVNVDKILGRIREKRMTQKEVAELLGIATRTMATRIETGKFWTDELEKLAEILEIESPGEFFWPKNSAKGN